MRHAWVTRLAASSILLGALATGAGCTWVREQTGMGSSDEAKRPDPPGLGKPYPNLATVPNKTPDTGTTRERLRIEEGLLADRQNARHVAGPVAGEERTSPVPPEAGTRTTIINPPSPGERRTAAAPGQPQRGGPIGSINYPKGTASLPEGSGRMIVRAAEAQRRFGGTIIVVGHAAASEGDAAARKALATRRATTVANGLLNLGVERDKIRVGPGAGDASRVDLALIIGR
ncbi:MAG: OmpA family protein [Rhodospirillaceae bacterium]|nr:OmpA family protein [Rhodospirillaceae bacterium]